MSLGGAFAEGTAEPGSKGRVGVVRGKLTSAFQNIFNGRALRSNAIGND